MGEVACNPYSPTVVRKLLVSKETPVLRRRASEIVSFL